jgi:hypothetical protein
VDQGQRLRRARGGVRTARRGVAAVLYLTAALAAVLDPSTLGVSLATSSVVLLTVGYRFRGDLASVASGWLLYFPLATAFTPVLGPLWSYLASGTYLAVITERLSFDNKISLVLEAPAGVDAEAKRRADLLSRTHLRRLAQVTLLVGVIAGLSLAGSLVFAEATVLILASVMLLIAVGYYATRSAPRKEIPRPQHNGTDQDSA